MTLQNGATPSDAICDELDRLESAITAVNGTLTPEFWTAARTTPAAAITIAELIEALVDLHLERDALRERGQSARTE